MLIVKEDVGFCIDVYVYTISRILLDFMLLEIGEIKEQDKGG